MIAAEPTTALDVTIQAQVVNLLEELQDKLGRDLLAAGWTRAFAGADPTPWTCIAALVQGGYGLGR